MRRDTRNFKPIDRRARMRLESSGVPTRPPKERVKDFGEIHTQLDALWAKNEASRCIHCLDPAPCQRACPAGIDISLALWHIEAGDHLAAAQVFRQRSSLPEICGRACPHERMCQGACVRSRVVRGTGGITIPIGALEIFATEYERRTVGIKIPVRPPTGCKVAVVGAGPAGLSCAEQLVRQGHWVTVYDNNPAPGGLLTYGIPSFILPKETIFAIWQDLQQAGVRFIGNTFIGKNITIDHLLRDGCEAIFLGVGIGVEVGLGIPGERLPGVYKATEFLTRANLDPKLLPPKYRSRLSIGQRIVVIGGGSTGSDCLRTGLRLGAEKVTCLYRRSEQEMPTRQHDYDLARAEGAEYIYLAQPIRFVAGEDGSLSTIECLRTKLGEPDESGRPRPIPIEGSNFFIEADIAVLALGYIPDPTIAVTTPGLKTHDRGLILADPETGATSRFGLFTGGDILTGPETVVGAMVAGRKAAHTIDAYLS